MTAGTGTTVTGTGQPGNPYVVSADPNPFIVLDTSSVDLTLTPGAPDVLSGVVKLDPAAGNLITLTASGLRVDCAAITAACAIGVAVTDTDTVDLTLGPGNNIKADVRVDSTTPGNLITVIPGGAPGGLRVDCSNVHSCFSAGLGISAASLATGLVQVCLSTAGGNTLSFGPDGCLYAAGGAGTPVTVTDTATVDLTLTGQDIMADVIIDPVADNLLVAGPAGLSALAHTDCGITGAGTTANPLRANVNPTFPAFPGGCAVNTGASVYCDPATGQLHVDPPQFNISGTLQSTGFDSTVPGLDPVGGGASVIPGTTVSTTITNPSPCRNMIVQIESGLLHLLIGQQPGSGNGRTEIELNCQISIAGAAAGNTPFINSGHQHWAMSGQVGGDRTTYDTTGAYTGRGAGESAQIITIAPGGVVTISVRGIADTIQSTNVPPATTLGLRFGARWTGYTV